MPLELMPKRVYFLRSMERIRWRKRCSNDSGRAQLCRIERAMTAILMRPRIHHRPPAGAARAAEWRSSPGVNAHAYRQGIGLRSANSW